MLNALPQRSKPNGVVKLGVAGQLMVLGAGNDGNIGALISCTVMV
jgi:hypothetical protein